MNVKIQYHKTPIGELIIGSYDNKLCLCDWRYRKMRDSIDTRIKKGLNAEFVDETSTVIQNTIGELEEYFNDKRSSFSIPLLLVGTDFQKLVWDVLLTIPFGQTESYISLSKKLKNEKAIRAVGTANGANAISILVPCHRIIGSNGDLVGYAGGLAAKKKLLTLENALDLSQLSLF